MRSVVVTLALWCGDDVPLYSAALTLVPVTARRSALVEPWWGWTAWLALAITIVRIKHGRAWRRSVS